MLVHSVYFWLKSSLSEEQVAAFRKGVETLGEISHAKAVYVGTPADTPERPVIDNSYTIALTVLLESLELHDAYQDDPIHLAFVQKFSSYWERLVVYDAE